MNDIGHIQNQFYPSEEAYLILSNLLSDFLFITSLDSNRKSYFDWISDSATKSIGYSSQEILNNKIELATLCHPDDLPALDQHIARLQSNQPDITELRLITKNKERRWVRVYAYPKWDITKKCVTHSFNAAIDISDRKWSQISLSINNVISHSLTVQPTSNTIFPEILQIICEGLAIDIGALWQKDPLSNSLYCVALWQNHSDDKLSPILSQYKCSPGNELPGRVWKTAEFEWCSDLLAQSCSGDKEIANQTSMRSAFAFPLILQGDVLGVLMFMDREVLPPTPLMKNLLISITHQIKQYLENEIAFEKLRQNEEAISGLLNAISDLIFRIDREGIILDYHIQKMNTSLAIPEKIIGRPLCEILSKEVAYKIESSIEETLIINKVQSFEFQLLNNSELYDFEARLVAIGKDECLLTLHDISERVKQEEIKSDYLNRASHELRTPLTTAILTADLIQEGGSVEELSEYWRILRGELERQRTIIEQFLTFGKLDHGKLKLNILPLKIDTVLNDTFNTILPIAQSKQITISKKITNNLPMIMGDQLGLQQVFVNLLSNAIKFSKPESEVSIIVDIKNEKFNDEKLKYVNITIKDNGIGIPSEDIPHLFTRFFRAHNAIENEIPGSGIGLFIIKNIIDYLNGKITVISEIGMGTTFEISFPAYDNIPCDK
ncbi:MAG: ATP-binding protein [Chloroflexota bacterium]